MFYLIGLFILFATLFSSMGGGDNLVADILGQAKDKVNETLFPKTAKEIIIDNINSDYENMDKFFSDTAPALLSSTTVSENDKETIKKAVEAFNGSKSLVSNLTQLEKDDKGILESVVDRVLNLTKMISPSPTNSPPQVPLECPK